MPTFTHYSWSRFEGLTLCQKATLHTRMSSLDIINAPLSKMFVNKEDAVHFFYLHVHEVSMLRVSCSGESRCSFTFNHSFVCVEGQREINTMLLAHVPVLYEHVLVHSEPACSLISSSCREINVCFRCQSTHVLM
jgi:hypothetical protein